MSDESIVWKQVLSNLWVGQLPDGGAVLHDGEVQTQAFTKAEWDCWLKSAREGEFDDLAQS